MHALQTSPLTLKHRLKIDRTPVNRGIWAVSTGIVLGLFAVLLILFDAFMAEDKNIRLIVIEMLVCLGLLLIYSGLLQLLAAKYPVTIVEMSKSALERGKVVNFFFSQAGPINLKTLRANLVGEEEWWSVNQEDDKTGNTRYLGAFNCFDSGPQKITEAVPFEAQVSFTVPQDIPASGKTPEAHKINWKIEVWGTVRGGVNFYHSYPVVVR